MPRRLDYSGSKAVPDLLERVVQRYPDRIALRTLDPADGTVVEELTYAGLWERARGLAEHLRSRGVEPGDRIGLVGANGGDLIVAYAGTWLAGAAAVPCSDLVVEDEVMAKFGDAAVRLLISTPATTTLVAACGRRIDVPVLQVDGAAVRVVENRPLRDASVQSPDGLALLLYTGGTTGPSKGAMLSHRNLVANTVQFSTWYQLEEGAETCLAVLPITHSGGMSGAMLVPLCTGSTVIAFPRFSPLRTVQAIEKHAVTRFFGVPTMYAAIVNNADCHGYDLSSLRACRSGAAPLPAALKRRFNALVGHDVLVEAYGLTEAGPLAIANPLDDARDSSIGLPLPDTDAMIDAAPGAAAGELLIRGPQVMLGYWQRPDETAAVMAGDGWLRTGDVARIDDDGFVYIVDRLKDLVISGGYNVWPREVEDVLYGHPDVELAAVFGVPDDYHGEAVYAVIQPREGRSVDVADIRRFCALHLTRYKVPKAIEVRDRLPTSGAGKVMRRSLKEDVVAATVRKGLHETGGEG